MNKGTILFLVSGNKHTGPARVALNHARLLREMGYNCLFCAQEGGSLHTAAEDAALWYGGSFALPLKGQVWNIALDILRVRRIVRRERVKLIFTYRSNDHMTAGLACGGRVPIVRFLHKPVEKINNSGMWLLRKKWTSYITVPDPTELAKLLVALGRWTPGGNCDTDKKKGLAALALDPVKTGAQFLSGGVDTIHFTPDRGGSTTRRELGLSDDNIVIGFVSRIKEERGHPIFVESFARAAGHIPELRALIIGDGLDRDKAAIREHANDFGVGGKVAIFDPGIHYDEALAAVDIGFLWHPGSSGCAQAALELMSMARPMVLGNKGILAYLDGDDGKAAFRIADWGEQKPIDELSDSFAISISTLATDPDQRFDMGLSARGLVESRFSRRVLQHDLDAICTRLIG